jgi:hypothetical protein
MDLATLASGQPLLLAFVFTRCAGVCSPFLTSWRAADRWVTSPRPVRRLVMSFDPRDSVSDMAALAQHVGVERDPNWTFAVASRDNVRRLTAAAGFWYEWDGLRQQYDHPAMLAAVMNGRIVRLLVGGIVTSDRLSELVREASGVFVPSYGLLDPRIRFRCVQYDARSGRPSIDWVSGCCWCRLEPLGLRRQSCSRPAHGSVSGAPAPSEWAFPGRRSNTNGRAFKSADTLRAPPSCSSQGRGREWRESSVERHGVGVPGVS